MMIDLFRLIFAAGMIAQAGLILVAHQLTLVCGLWLTLAGITHDSDSLKPECWSAEGQREDINEQASGLWVPGML